MTAETGPDHKDLDDATLVQRATEGDEAALAALVLRYERLVYSIPFRCGLRHEHAADVFQSVWMRFVQTLPTFRDPSRIRSWLITTATRECWRVAKRSRRETQFDDGGDPNEPSALPDVVDPRPLAEDEQLLVELQDRVRAAVALLPERCQLLISILFYENDDASYAELSRRLGIPLNSVSPTRSRCFEKLRLAMAEIERRSSCRDR